MRKIIRTPEEKKYKKPNLPQHFLRLNEWGYEIDGETGQYVHRIVYEEVHGEIPYGQVIHHIDGQKLNNDLDNLIALPDDYHAVLHERFKMYELPDRIFIELDLRHWNELIVKYWDLVHQRNDLTSRISAISDTLSIRPGFFQRKRGYPSRSRRKDRKRKRKKFKN